MILNYAYVKVRNPTLTSREEEVFTLLCVFFYFLWYLNCYLYADEFDDKSAEGKTDYQARIRLINHDIYHYNPKTLRFVVQFISYCLA